MGLARFLLASIFNNGRSGAVSSCANFQRCWARRGFFLRQFSCPNFQLWWIQRGVFSHQFSAMMGPARFLLVPLFSDDGFSEVSSRANFQRWWVRRGFFLRQFSAMRGPARFLLAVLYFSAMMGPARFCKFKFTCKIGFDISEKKPSKIWL